MKKASADTSEKPTPVPDTDKAKAPANAEAEGAEGANETETLKDSTDGFLPVPKPITVPEDFDAKAAFAYATEVLKELRLSGMRSELTDQVENMTDEEKRKYLYLLDAMVRVERSHRDTNRLHMLMRTAGFQLPSAAPENIVFIKDRHLSRDTLNKLLDCSFILDHRHAVIMGATGCGKTYIACAIGVAACRAGYRVKFIRLPDLLNEYVYARQKESLDQFRSQYAKYKLVIIDEWLLRPLDLEDSYELLEIIDFLVHTVSMIFCSQFNTDEWYHRIDCVRGDGKNSTIAEAVLDRIIHNAYPLVIETKESMRKHYGLKPNGDGT